MSEPAQPIPEGRWNEPVWVAVHCSMSRAIVMHGYGPPEVLRLEEVELPALAAGEIRVRSLASPVNHSDLEIRAGNWPIVREPPFPYVPGLEVVGEVIEAGSEVDLPIGARVMTMMQGLGGIRAQRDGGYAEHVTLSAESVAQIPDGLDPLEIGALGLAAVTAYLGLSRLGSFAGKRVLVTGAAGGVGSAAVSLARAQGAEVMGVVSRAEQVEYVRSLGASHVVVSKEQSIDEAVEPRSVDRILDTVAGELFPQLIRTLRPGGGLSLVGAVGGGDVKFDAWALLLPMTITGYSSETLDGRSLRTAVAAICAALASGDLTPPARTVFPLAEAAQAHQLLEDHGVEGRVILVPDDL